MDLYILYFINELYLMKHDIVSYLKINCYLVNLRSQVLDLKLA